MAETEVKVVVFLCVAPIITNALQGQASLCEELQKYSLLGPLVQGWHVMSV